MTAESAHAAHLHTAALFGRPVQRRGSRILARRWHSLARHATPPHRTLSPLSPDSPSPPAPRSASTADDAPRPPAPRPLQPCRPSSRRHRGDHGRSTPARARELALSRARANELSDGCRACRTRHTRPRLRRQQLRLSPSCWQAQQAPLVRAPAHEAAAPRLRRHRRASARLPANRRDASGKSRLLLRDTSGKETRRARAGPAPRASPGDRGARTPDREVDNG